MTDPSAYRNAVLSLRNDSKAESFFKKTKIHNDCSNIPFFLDIPICDEFVFDCDRRIWQAALFEKFLFYRTSKEIYLSSICNWILKYRAEGKFNIKWTYTYRTHQHYSLINQVIKKYLSYLEALGFIKQRDLDIWELLANGRYSPPNKGYAKKLKEALKRVDGYCRDVNEKIADFIDLLER